MQGSPMPKKPIFAVGQTVMLLKPRHDKLSAMIPKWLGPFWVIREDHPRYWLKDDEGRVSRKGVHARRLKVFNERGVAHRN